VVGDEGGVCREGQFGNWASAVAGVQPALDGGAVEGVAGREDDGVGHDFQGNRTLEVVRKLSLSRHC